jgi:hypothetical protein
MTTDWLTQSRADELIAIEKHATDAEVRDYPAPGGKLTAPLVSFDGAEQFLLDVTRGQISLNVSHQTRHRKTTVLVRLDLTGAWHRNPDDTEIPTPHIHLYQEGYDDKWAYSLPPGVFGDLADLFRTLQDFMTYCNITHPPLVRARLV